MTDALNMSLDAIIDANRSKAGGRGRGRGRGRDREPARASQGQVTVQRPEGVLKALKAAAGNEQRAPRAGAAGLGVSNAGISKPQRRVRQEYVEEAEEDYGYGAAPARRGRGRGRAQAFRDVPAGNPDGQWSHDLFQDVDNRPPRRVHVAGGGSGGGGGISQVKLLVSNLDYSVTEKDLKELFEMCGTVVSAVIKYDRSGRSEGEATITFTRKADAAKAIAEYAGVALDGKVMSIEYAPEGPVVQQLSSGRVLTRPGGGGIGAAPSVPGRRVFQQSISAAVVPARSGPRPARGGRGMGRLRSTAVTHTRAQLDAEMDAMHE